VCSQQVCSTIAHAGKVCFLLSIAEIPQRQFPRNFLVANVTRMSCLSGRWNLENDTKNGQTGSTTVASRRPTNRGKLNGEVASILVTCTKLRGCYEDVTICRVSGVSQSQLQADYERPPNFAVSDSAVRNNDAAYCQIMWQLVINRYTFAT